jgi:hypothetical protein
VLKILRASDAYRENRSAAAQGDACRAGESVFQMAAGTSPSFREYDQGQTLCKNLLRVAKCPHVRSAPVYWKGTKTTHEAGKGFEPEQLTLGHEPHLSVENHIKQRRVS